MDSSSEREAKKPKVAPKASVLCCCYNGARYLPQMLESVLSQTYKGPIELCIFDDASTDNSREIVDEWTPRLEERGIAVVRGSHTGKRNESSHTADQTGQALSQAEALVALGLPAIGW